MSKGRKGKQPASSGSGQKKKFHVSKPDFSKATKADKIKFVVLAVVVVLLVVIGIACIPFFKSLFTGDERQQVVADVRAKGPLGILLIIGIEILQVVVAIIPGEFVQMISGILYGTIGGCLVLLVGVVIGGCIVYKVVERLGMPLVRAVISDEMVDKLDFLNDNKRIDFIVFVLFFIPGLPKDVFTYFVPLTEMPMSRFIAVSSIARTPALIASTYAGAAFTSGNYTGMIVIFVICGGLGLLGIWKRDIIFDWFRDKKDAVRALIGTPGGRRDVPAGRSLPGDVSEAQPGATGGARQRSAGQSSGNAHDAHSHDGASRRKRSKSAHKAGPVQARFKERTRTGGPYRPVRPTYTGGSPKSQVIKETAKNAAKKTGQAVSSTARQAWSAVSKKASTTRPKRPSRRDDVRPGHHGGKGSRR